MKSNCLEYQQAVKWLSTLQKLIENAQVPKNGDSLNIKPKILSIFSFTCHYFYTSDFYRDEYIHGIYYHPNLYRHLIYIFH